MIKVKSISFSNCIGYVVPDELVEKLERKRKLEKDKKINRLERESRGGAK